MVACALDPAGDYPGAPQGPGLTVDEIFNVDLGVRLADHVLSGDVTGAIRAGQTLPDHPPLGRLWLGLFHEAVLLVAPPAGEHAPLVVAAARFGSAVAFGLLVWLVGVVSGRWYGAVAGWGAAVGMILMPRLFGHAHLAALETVLNLTYMGAVLSVASGWASQAAPSSRTAFRSGLWLGLALLTKIQAILIPIPVVVWALWNWRQRAFRPLVIWGVTGLVVFMAGWPWLWLDPIGNLGKYLGHASNRAVLQVWYAGQMFADRHVPWHYPWVLFCTTLPVGLLLLGALGVFARQPVEVNTLTPPQRTTRCYLLANVLFPLVVFSLPGVAVYDGERLFLIVFPVWALFVGRGLAVLSNWLAVRLSPGLRVAGLVLVLAAQGGGIWQYSPCWLSYYNAIAGGLAGAERVGFQVTYWGDSVTRELWQRAGQQVPEGALIDVAPVLHPFQLAAWELQCPVLRVRKLKLQPWDGSAPAKFLIVYYRRDYLPADWQPVPPHYRALFEVRRQRVTLAGLYERE